MPASADLLRLAALHRYSILDTYPETPFERLTRLAAAIFDAPMALISLLDEDRQWFKSHFGLDTCETPTGISFCAHAIQSDAVLVIPDATKDPRFFQSPPVMGEPYVRFYAGAPLRTPGGVRIGTLCILDTLPRRALQNTEQQILTDLAALAVDEMELRLLKRQARLANNPILSSASDLAASVARPEQELSK